jgi:hypothetical protein
MNTNVENNSEETATETQCESIASHSLENPIVLKEEDAPAVEASINALDLKEAGQLHTENDVKKEMEQTTSPAVQENYLENSLCEGTMGSLATGDDEVFVVSHLIIEQSVVEQSVSNIAEEVCGEKVEERYLQAQMEENAVGDDTAKKKQSASLSQVGRSQRSLHYSTGNPTNTSRDAPLDPIQRLS